MVDLSGKVALITGSSLGIGRGCALEMAKAGADVVVNYRSHRGEADEVADEIAKLGRGALVCHADVADRPAVDRMVQAAISRFGHLDIVVANAAWSRRTPFLEIQVEDMQRVLDVCLWGVFHICQLGAREMVRQGAGGKIVIISSLHAFLPFPTALAYNTAKAGINHMGFTMAGELTKHRINVNVIEPGWTDTPGERAFFTEEFIQERSKTLPWGRLGTIEEIGKTAAFLSSGDADYITGASLRVDGGFWLDPWKV